MVLMDQRAVLARKKAEADVDVAAAELCAAAYEWGLAVEARVATQKLRALTLDRACAYHRALVALRRLPMVPGSIAGVDDAAGVDEVVL
jgi:hypothetical protein